MNREPLNPTLIQFTYLARSDNNITALFPWVRAERRPLLSAPRSGASRRRRFPKAPPDGAAVTKAPSDIRNAQPGHPSGS